jgi:acyl-CoA reductase-like NAD-dependent aldehyde dehydrogenase
MQQNYINGQWCDALNSNQWSVFNPATEELITMLPFGDATDAHLAIDAAAAAFPMWRRTNPWQRAEILKKTADLMRSRAKDLAKITTAEAGKPIVEAIGEWTVAAQFFEWYAEEGKRATGKVLPANRNNKRMSVIAQPIGVVGIVTAWNFPIWNVCRAWAASLAAGCTFVAKPSEYTPLTAMALIGLLEEAGLPAGVANLVLGDAASIGQAMLDRPELRKIHFVGSTRVGKLLMDGASKTNTRLSLELGGNAPCIALPDVDIKAFAKSAAVAKTRNCGQVCVSPQRFLIHKDQYESFCEIASEHLSAYKIGNGAMADTQLGPLINARQRDSVEAVVHTSIQQGAFLRCGGKRPVGLEKGYFFEPTLLANVTRETAVFRQEIFGPVMCVTAYETEQEAVSLANDSEYGLAAYLFTNDLRASIRISEALEYGIVGINEWNPHAIEAPFGGWKQSGQGYECGEEGLHEYLEKKLVAWGDL